MIDSFQSRGPYETQEQLYSEEKSCLPLSLTLLYKDNDMSK